MLTFDLSTGYDDDLALAHTYAESTTPGESGGDDLDPYGLYDYFINGGIDGSGTFLLPNGPNGSGYRNMGLDGNGEFYWKKDGTNLYCRLSRGSQRLRCRSSHCCPCIADIIPCNANIQCPTCAGHDIVVAGTIPYPPQQFSSGAIVPPEVDFYLFNRFGKMRFADNDVNPYNMNLFKTLGGGGITGSGSFGNMNNNGGAVGDPHFEGFDRPFDFHGEIGKCYQLYKSETLIINTKIAPAYHCQTGGTFMEGLYIQSYKDGKKFEIVFSIWGIADASHVFEPINKLDNNLLAYQAQSKSFKEEFNSNKWNNQKGVVVKTDIGDIYLIQSNYLSQPHVNFKFSLNKLELLEDATGVIGQTQNMKMRLPNESFEVEDIFSKDIRKIITPDMYFPVRYFGMGKEPCFTCQDKLDKKDIYVDDNGKKWSVDDNIII